MQSRNKSVNHSQDGRPPGRLTGRGEHPAAKRLSRFRFLPPGLLVPAVLSGCLITAWSAAGSMGRPSRAWDEKGAVRERDQSAADFEFVFDFRNGLEGWTGAFADYPAGGEADYELVSGWCTLPSYLDRPGHALFLSGHNHSDDLFMFLKHRLAGLKPLTLYQIHFRVELATNAPAGCAGIGGSPGTAVILKCGAAAIEPQRVIPADEPGMYRLNLDKGNQSAGGWDAVPAGHIGNELECPDDTYVYKELETGAVPFPAVTGPDGGLWVLAGTDSGFEGATSLYYSRIVLRLTEAGAAGDLDGDRRLTAGDLLLLRYWLADMIPAATPPFSAPAKAGDVNGHHGPGLADALALAQLLEK